MKEIFDPNLQILHSLIFRRALPVRCGMAGANDASLFPANQKGARVLPFSAAGGMPSAMLAGLADRPPSPQLFRFFDTTIIPTLAPRCVTTAFNGSGGVNYTIWVLKAAKKGLSARVSDNQSLHGYCHSYHCKEKKAHGLYNYQVIYIFLLCIKYILSCILNI